jgi:hypothetical protein
MDDALPGPTLTGTFRTQMDCFAMGPGVLALLPEAARAVLADLVRDRELVSEGLVLEAPEHGPVRLEGDLAFVVPADVPPGEGPRGRVHFEPLVLEDLREEESALGGRVRFDGFSMDVGAALEDLRGVLEIERLRLGSEGAGRARAKGLSARIEGIEVEGLDAPLVWDGGVMRVEPIRARVAGGAATARFAMHTGEPAMYEGAVRVDDLDLARLAGGLSASGTAYSGRARVEITFENPTGDAEDLVAVGTAQVRQADLGDLPFVANIFALGAHMFQASRKPSFERADLEFRLRNESIHFSRLDLSGDLFEMPGSGTVDTDGLADLVFRPHFVKSLLLPGVMQVPGLGDVLGVLLPEDWFYAVRIRGDLETAQPEVVALPPLGLDRRRVFDGPGPGTLPERQVPGWFR